MRSIPNVIPITLLKFVSTVFQKALNVAMDIGLPMNLPALFTRILSFVSGGSKCGHVCVSYSTGPKSCWILVNVSCTSASSVTSQAYACTLTLKRSQAALVSDWSCEPKSRIATCAPELARFVAIALPIPKIQSTHSSQISLFYLNWSPVRAQFLITSASPRDNGNLPTVRSCKFFRRHWAIVSVIERYR